MKKIVDAPELKPAAHSLVASANEIPESDTHWMGGLTFVPEGCIVAEALPLDCLSIDGSFMTPAACVDEIDYVPWLLNVQFERPGGWSQDDVVRLATRALEQTETAALEEAVVYGDGTVGNQFIADNATTVTTTASGPAAAIGLIQQEFTEYGTAGTIYASPLVAQLLPNLFLADGATLRTMVRRDLVIVGNLGSKKPDGSAATAGTSWLFGHLGEPEMRRGQIEVTTEFDHTINQHIVTATRTVAINFNPCLTVAAEVNVNGSSNYLEL